MFVCLLGHMSPLLAAILMPLSSAISLAIVGLGLRGGKIDDGKVEFDHAGGYAGSVASEQPSNSNDSGSNGLRPHPV